MSNHNNDNLYHERQKNAEEDKEFANILLKMEDSSTKGFTISYDWTFNVGKCIGERKSTSS